MTIFIQGLLRIPFRQWLSPALVVLPLVLLGQNPTAAGVFDRTNIETGDTFSLRILVSGTQARPDRVDFAAWSNWISEENVLRRTGWEHSGQQWITNCTLIAFDSFSTTLPPLAVRLVSGDSAMTNPMPLTVTATASPDSPAGMDPIRDIKEEAIRWTDWSLLLALLAALYFGVRFWLNRKKKPVQVVPPAPAPVQEAPVPADKVALDKLAQLAKDQPWKKGQVKTYYAELSLIVNEFLEHRYQIPAMESTTRETELLLKKTNFPPLLLHALKSILQQSDLAKYAQDWNAEKDHGAFIKQAEELVKKCI